MELLGIGVSALSVFRVTRFCRPRFFSFLLRLTFYYEIVFDAQCSLLLWLLLQRTDERRPLCLALAAADSAAAAASVRFSVKRSQPRNHSALT